MRVSTDRHDLAKRYPAITRKTAVEYHAFTSRSWRTAMQTEMGEMIVAAIENWVPPDDLRAQTTKDGSHILRMVMAMPPLARRYSRRIQDHKNMAQNLAEIARQTGAQPLLWGD
jgi:predicted xylose isomerase-like sugar epimerase